MFKNEFDCHEKADVCFLKTSVLLVNVWPKIDLPRVQFEITQLNRPSTAGPGLLVSISIIIESVSSSGR